MSQRLASILRLAAVLALLCPAAVAAQIDTGTIVGRVQDPDRRGAARASPSPPPRTAPASPRRR